MSTKAKIITGLIYLLAAALLITVVYLNMHPGDSSADNAATNTKVSGEANATGTGNTPTELPYNPAADDKYADIEPAYKVEDVTIEKDGNDVWSAFVDDKKATDYTGVAKNEYGWFFVRDGEVDFNYNGIAGNERGNWYVKNGKVDFNHTGTFKVNGNEYRVVEGQVVE